MLHSQVFLRGVHQTARLRLKETRLVLVSAAVEPLSLPAFGLADDLTARRGAGWWVRQAARWRFGG